MADRREPPKDPFAAFVVETQVKLDGRLIHYYSWPNQPPEPDAQGAEPLAPREPAEGRRV